MSRTAIPIHTTGRGSNGLDITALTGTVGDTVNGMSLANDGRTTVDIKNTNSGSTAHIATFRTNVSADAGIAASTDPESVPAGHTITYGPFPVNIYGGNVKIDAAHAELTFLARRLGS